MRSAIIFNFLLLVILTQNATAEWLLAPYLATCPHIMESMGHVMTPLTLEDLNRVVLQLEGPALHNFAIETQTFASATDFLRSTVNQSTIFEIPERRTYQILVNPRLLAEPPSAAGLEAILVHELNHIKDYIRMDFTTLMAFAFRYVLFPVTQYEHQTDEKALRQGRGCGLIEFRLWLYAHETESAAADKRRDYYTPGEIVSWMNSHAMIK